MFFFFLQFRSFALPRFHSDVKCGFSHVPRIALSSFRCTTCSKWAPALPGSPHRRPQPTDRPSDRPVNRSAGRSAGRSAAWLPGRSGDRGSGSLPADRKAPARLQSPGAHTLQLFAASTGCVCYIAQFSFGSCGFLGFTVSHAVSLGYTVSQQGCSESRRVFSELSVHGNKPSFGSAVLVGFHLTTR